MSDAGGGGAARRAPWFLFVAVNLLALPFALQGIHFDDSDTFYHLAGGRWMLEHGRVLGHESFSFTLQGQPWTNYYWLFQLLLGVAEQLGGLRGATLVRGAFVLATASLLLAWLWRRSGREVVPALATTLLGLALYMARALNVRPHLASHLILLAVLIRLDRWRERPTSFDPVLPLLFVLWANLHGVEYPVGLAAVGVCAVAALVDRWRAGDPPGRGTARILLVPAACLAALLVNPFGVRLLAAPGIAGDVEMMTLIDEMRAPGAASLLDLRPSLDINAQVWLNVALLAGIALVPRWVRRRDLVALGFFAMGAWLALDKLRFRPEAGILLVPLLAAELAREGTAARRAVKGGVAVLAALLLTAFSATIVRHANLGFFQVVDLARYPVGPCEMVRRHGLVGNVLADPANAGYMTWCSPSLRVLMDMRSPDPFGASWYWLGRAAGVQVPIERIDAAWPLDLLLFRVASPAAARGLSGGIPGFVPVSIDGAFVLMAREEIARARGLALPEPMAIDGWDGSLARAVALREQSARLLEVWPLNPLAHETLARLDLAAGRSAEALERAARLAGVFPRDPTWPWVEGLALGARGERAEGVARLEQALERGPGSARLTTDLAVAHLGAGNAARAVELLEQLAIREQYLLDPRAFILLGTAREAAGRSEAALDAYRRALWLLGDAEVAALAADPAAPVTLRMQAERARAAGRRF